MDSARIQGKKIHKNNVDIGIDFRKKTNVKEIGIFSVGKIFSFFQNKSRISIKKNEWKQMSWCISVGWTEQEILFVGENKNKFIQKRDFLG